MKKEKLSAVFEEDLPGLLRKIGLSNALESGELFCIKCGAQINSSNLQIIMPRQNGVYEFVCSTPECVEGYFSKKEA